MVRHEEVRGWGEVNSIHKSATSSEDELHYHRLLCLSRLRRKQSYKLIILLSLKLYIHPRVCIILMKIILLKKKLGKERISDKHTTILIGDTLCSPDKVEFCRFVIVDIKFTVTCHDWERG